MKTYQGSDEHLLNCAIASKAGSDAQRRFKLERIERYANNPRLCDECNEPLSYEKRKNKFCNSSCSGKKSNRGRVKSEDERSKIRNTLHLTRLSLGTTTTAPGEPTRKRVSSNGPRVIPRIAICKICKTEFSHTSRAKRLTCGTECQTRASVGCRTYRNGRRKLFYYFNHIQETEVLLESSWELAVAKHLDSKGVRWVRPGYVRWVDNNGKNRLYYPDFELIDYGLFLDPKNSTAARLETDKMAAVSKLINLKTGTLDQMLSVIDDLPTIP
jgi:hypothetical protein